MNGLNSLSILSILILGCMAAFCTGLSKGGLGALGSLVMPILLVILPDPRQAVSLATLLFLLGDLGAVCFYFRSGRLSILLRLLPLSALGIFLGFWLGKQMPISFYLVILTALSGVAFTLLVFQKYQNNKPNHQNQGEHKRAARSLPSSVLTGTGIVAGFSTVLGNSSGVFMSFYLSALRLPKQGFVATMAIYYLLINLSKLLLYYFYWHSLDFSILAQLRFLTPWLILSLVCGLVTAIFTVHKMNERIFSLSVLLASLVALLLLCWRTLEYFGIV